MNASFEFRRAVLSATGPGSNVGVGWTEYSGGTTDPGTGAAVGGTATRRTGVLRALVYEEPARGVLRQFAEIQAGDVILDVLPDATVQPDDGTAAIPLTDLAALHPRFIWNGATYVPRDLGRALLSAIDATVGLTPISRSIVLRPAT